MMHWCIDMRVIRQCIIRPIGHPGRMEGAGRPPTGHQLDAALLACRTGT